MSWIRSMIRLIPTSRPPVDQQAFKRRQAELQSRFDRLSREVEVVQRTDSERRSE